MRFPIAMILSTALAMGMSTANAATMFEATHTCPINGEKFTRMERGAVLQVGKMLDLKPYGDFEGVWPLVAVCPGNGFVIYKNDFKAEELEKAKAFIQSPDYLRIKDQETPRYLAVRLARVIGEDDDSIAVLTLMSTWEARNPEEYARYAQEALVLYRTLLAKPDAAKDPMWPSRQLLAGEFERRLSMFAEAQARFEELRKNERFKQPGIFSDLLEYQLKLVQEKNSASQQIPKTPTK